MSDTFEKYLLVLRDPESITTRFFTELYNTGALNISLSSLGVFQVIFQTILRVKRAQTNPADWEAVLLNLRTKQGLAMEKGEFYRLGQTELCNALLELSSRTQDWQHFPISTQQAEEVDEQISAFRQSVRSSMRHVDVRSDGKRLTPSDLDQIGWVSSI